MRGVICREENNLSSCLSTCYNSPLASISFLFLLLVFLRTVVDLDGLLTFKVNQVKEHHDSSLYLIEIVFFLHANNNTFLHLVHDLFNFGNL